MSQVAVVTDTTHYLPRDVVAREQLHEVSLYVTTAGHQEREADITDLDAFYASLRGGGELPTTSQPSVGDFLAAYEPLLDAGQDIVSIHLSGGLSGTCDSARQAAIEALRTRPERSVEVVDSGSTAGGLALMVLAGSAAARGGRPVAEVAARVQAAVEDSKIWFSVDTLEYFRRGGRIGAAQAWVGGALKIKPILTIRSEVVPIERVRTSSRAFERLFDHLTQRKEDGASAWGVQHIQAPDQAERMIDRGRELFGSEPCFLGEVGPVLGTYSGPGMLGVAGMDGALLAA